MTSPEVQHITSRDNPLLKELRKLAHDPGAYAAALRSDVQDAGGAAP